MLCVNNIWKKELCQAYLIKSMNVKNLARIFLLATVLSALAPQSVFAVVNPTSLPAITVSAHVENTTPPTVPILISPVNNAFINSHYITFCFKKSTSDYSQISYYQLFINDSVVINQIPSSQTASDTICVDYQTYLDDGPYTWKIRAYDSNGNLADSATWLFNVDTVPPSIIITRINENENLNLTTDVPASIPDGLVIKTNSNYPQFIGKTESSITVLITLTGSEDNKIYLLPKTTSNSDGSFSITSDQYIPFGQYKVNILASDYAGNTAVMKEFSLLITAKGWPPIITPTELISKTLELVGLGPTKPEIPQEQLPGIEEPGQPQQLLQLPAYPVKITAYELYIIFAGLLLLILYLILIRYGLGIIPCLMPSFLWFLLCFFGKRKSITYCSLHKKGLSFTTIKIFKVYRNCHCEERSDAAIPSGPGDPARDCFVPLSGTRNDTVIEEISKLLTNLEGKFNLKLTDGVWKLKACRPGFVFPSLMVTGPTDGKFTNVYHDEYLQITDNNWQLILPELISTANVETRHALSLPNYLSLPLDPNPNKSIYNKYQRIIFCAKLIGVFLGFWAVALFFLLPSWLSLLVFILFATIAIRTLEIH